MHRLEGRTGGLASPRARRCSGLFARLVGRNQPVFYVRHSLRVLLESDYRILLSFDDTQGNTANPF
jgi:hypothetical protein